MSEAPATQGDTYDDLAGFPHDGYRLAPLDVHFAHAGADRRDGTPALLGSGEQLTTPAAPGLRVAVDDVLGRG